MKHSRPVYSTESGRLCPKCGRPQNQCQCRSKGSKTSKAPQAADNHSTTTIRRERKGRGGKEVSVIRDLPLNATEIQLLASNLRKHCGSGGTVSNGCVEIQGDHREKIKLYLEGLGIKVKLAGG